MRALAAVCARKGSETIAHLEPAYVGLIGHFGAQLRKGNAVPTRAGAQVVFAALCVMGGLGGLGLCAARHFAHAGAVNIGLSSRRGVVMRYAGQELDEWLLLLCNHSNCMARVVACDVSDQQENQLNVPMAMHGTEGVLQVSGTASRAELLIRMAEPSFESLFAPKARAAGHMLLALLQLPLSSMLMFSSVAAAFDNMGLAGYAAANAALDSLAWSCRDRSLVASSIQWPQVRGDAGMGAYGISMGAKPLFTISLDEFVSCLSRASRTDLSASWMPWSSTAQELDTKVPLR